MGRITLQNRIYDSIFQDPDNGDLETVRTTAKGQFSVQGMNSLKTTCMQITDVETKLPSDPYDNRKSMTIYVLSGGTLYLGNIGVTADNALGNNAGIPVFENSTWNVDFASQTDIYGIAETGKTLLIKIVEYA